MATNLLIANAGAAVSGSHAVVGKTEDPRYPASNLFGGNRTDLFRLDATTTGATVLKVDAMEQKGADYLYVARADLLKASGVANIALKGNNADDYATATTVYSDSSFSSAALSGPGRDDYLATFAKSAAYWYWYVVLTAAAPSRLPCSKIFFGEAFDIGRDPDGDPKGEVTATRTRPSAKRGRPTYALDVSWNGVAQPRAVEMYERFSLNRRRDPVILFTTSYHEILSGHRVLFGRFLDVTMPPRVTDYCDVAATFEEVL